LTSPPGVNMMGMNDLSSSRKFQPTMACLGTPHTVRKWPCLKMTSLSALCGRLLSGNER
jgi:hypothetical protein